MSEQHFFLKEMTDMRAELSGMHAEMKGLRERIDDALISQMRDHGKRLAALENWRVWLVGWSVGAGAAGSLLASAFLR